ncbi:MAG: hypothetical protein ACXAEU_06555 [Candidatus Hodarchaeales archaeon]
MKFKKLDDEQGLTLFFDEVVFTIGRKKASNIPYVKYQIMTVPGRKAQKTQREILTEGTNGVVIFLDGGKKAFDENKRALIHLKELLGTQLMNREIPFRILVNKKDLPAEEKMFNWQISQLFLEAGYTFTLDVFQNLTTWISCKDASLELQSLLTTPDKSNILTKRGTLDKRVRPAVVKDIMTPMEELLPEIIDMAIKNHS